MELPAKHHATDCPQADKAMDQAAALELDRAEEEFQVASQEYAADFNTAAAAGDMSMKAASLPHCPHHHSQHHHCTHHHAAAAHRTEEDQGG
jgi:hypothetical protein